ncbi:branched-chain-amino-acid aminotransferase, cytosolic isoform X2 [Lepeophtheirus salmonis]|uniref:branched-chain-amino-acid aminotransferase, cytosolic isoform X2 n=1 Tax=Lepeophtheirus salmonis TaxID=72036 RepID=UPI001AEA5D15|nr:branched-chain-amino-acid aminotransferase, cytosolic-like isoform X2 [Lepeophtheirus salmonis]
MNWQPSLLLKIAPRCIMSRSYVSGLESSKLQIVTCCPSQLKSKPRLNQLSFGKIFTDHMLSVSWNHHTGWTSPLIKPLENLSIHPGSKVLHYAQEIFEGLKAFRGIDDKIRLFRPLHNMERMNLSAKRSKLPNFHGTELLQCIRRLLEIEQEWVPHFPGSSLYIRPTLIGTEPALGVNPSNEAKLYVLLCPVGPYFNSVEEGVNLLADSRFTRSYPGGCGFAKMGCNYAPTLWTQSIASSHNCAQNLWLFGEDHEITEVGAMNIFIYLINRKTGLKELVTPSLEKGLILPGVVRRSIIELSQEIFKNEFVMSEKSINMNELLEALKEERLIEIFGAGTAATICPIKGIHYDGVMHKIPFENPEKVSNRSYCYLRRKCRFLQCFKLKP